MSLSAADFELLLQANRILSSKLDDQEVVQAVMELATKVVRADASSLLLLDPATNELTFDVALGSVKDRVKQIRLKVGEGIAGWVAENRVPLIVNDVASDPRFTKKVDVSTDFRTRNILAVPLLSKGDLLGVVEAINKESGASFTEADQEILSVFASQAAVAIQNARLFSEVARERKKLATVFEAISDGVLLLDAEGRVILANLACAGMLGASGEAAVGKRFAADLLTGFESSPVLTDPPSFRDRLTRLVFHRTTGKDFFLGAVALRLDPSNGGGREGWLVILRDETEERLEGRLKQSFLSVVSHKLKTPLTVILGYAPGVLLHGENLSEFQRKAVEAISEQGQKLAELVDKLLRFTLVESDQLPRNPSSVPALRLVQEAREAVESFRADRGATVEIDPSVVSAPAVYVDPQLAVEVFKNLIENGIKFNDKAQRSVKVTATVGDASVAFEVRDNGVGIPPEEREKVFQKFYQVENYFTGQVPGAGLGLSLCRKFTEAMGGRISLASEIGAGTAVTVELPRRPENRN